MRNIALVFSCLALFSFSSCTYYFLEEVQGGHSPMLQLDGQWQVDEHTATEDGATTDLKRTNSVWLNATQDVGGYCEGTWYHNDNTGDEEDEFLWNIDGEATQFTVREENNAENSWKVIEQRKNKFIIERTEDNVKYRMELSK